MPSMTRANGTNSLSWVSRLSRRLMKHPRLLEVLVERGDEAQLVVVELDSALDAPDRDPRGADADDAFLESVCPERLDGIDAPRA